MPRSRGEEKTPRLIRFFSWVALIVLFDQFTKGVAISRLNEGQSVAVIPGIFQWTLIYNTGIAFGFLRHHDTFLFFLITASIVLLAVLSLKTWFEQGAGRYALVLILGGAVGNWIDRFRYGAVVDFLDFRVWPVFNAADSAITIGVCLVLWLFLRPSKKSPARGNPEKIGL